MYALYYTNGFYERFYADNYFRKNLFDSQPEDADYVPLPEERPGGFEWGNRVIDEDNGR